MKETAYGKSKKTTVINLVFKFYFAHNDERSRHMAKNHMAFVLDPQGIANFDSLSAKVLL